MWHACVPTPLLAVLVIYPQVEKELAILQQLHHPHLVSFMFIADQGSRISIVMDWAGENLREHRTVTQSQQYTEDVARHMMYQLTSALVYLHAKVGVTLACLLWAGFLYRAGLHYHVQDCMCVMKCLGRTVMHA